MKKIIALCAIALLTACANSEQRDLAVVELDCRTGLYLNAEGEALALTPAGSSGYRWRMLDGRSGALDAAGGASRLGVTEEPDGFEAELGACGDDRISFGPSGALQSYFRAPVQITDVTYTHDGLTFGGRLIWPAGAEHAPLVVHVHGSGRASQVRSGSMQWLLAAQGIASFAYDKRGTGLSEGQYTQDFEILSADARAALAQARSMAGERITRAGYVGASQGGWVAPLAASESNVDFVVALYGLAVSPLEEDRSEVVQNLALAGWGPDEQAKGAALSDAAGVIMASNFREGFEEFDRLRREYREEAWYQDIDGEFTSEMLPHPALALRLIGPTRSVGTTWRYDPMPVLRRLDTPQFWMIAGDDTEAPPQETVTRIRALQAEGRQIDLAIYPGADHGMWLTERTPAGVRQTAQVRDYYRAIGEWILSRDLSVARAAGAEVELARTP
ncbi:MAG: alpha/beta hydrolase [Hyphomonadaceae bacterium]|nr:alpha/beta hydrolase [Hyphomonadaceae bacterium]